ncbi:unnamed protein product [Rotaria sordida]|uniref:Uncharacterized protein n=1 Tax=Rotaria sordida TaxID=392033 RepID=A0A814A1D5_9BILA|nr:unnamed protein product [Rotaria sordida]CAF0927240.1 unnamed protein product [Rotaria sordida]
MSHIIRRHSMEHLELYDLDKLKINYQLTSQLSPTCKDNHPYSLINSKHEHDQFLCNIKRNKIDPIYAATPMFTTIPQRLNEENCQQQLIDSSIHLENIKTLSCRSLKSTEEEGKNNDNDHQLKHDDCKEIIEKIFNRH